MAERFLRELMINNDRPSVGKKPEGINKKKDDTDEYWVSGPTILIILIVAVSTVIYASLNPTQRKTTGVASDYRSSEK